MKLTKIIEKEYEDVSETVARKLVSPKKDVKLIYEVMPTQSTYAKGVHALRNSYVGKEAEVPSYLWYECNDQKIVRPLTFRENLQARVDDFETLKNKDGSIKTINDRLRLFTISLDSCMGVAYSSKNEDDFMIIPVCRELITIPKDFRDQYMQINYANLQGKGISLKRSQVKYNTSLSESEVITHPAWIASVEGDISLLCTYASIVFRHLSRGEGKAMGFCLRNEISEDQLRSLFVYNGDNTSIANGNINLYNYIIFLRATLPSS